MFHVLLFKVLFKKHPMGLVVNELLKSCNESLRYCEDTVDEAAMRECFLLFLIFITIIWVSVY